MQDSKIANLLHDLQQPMVAIKGYLSMVLDGNAGEISEKAKEFIQKAYESNERMIEMVGKLASEPEGRNKQWNTYS